MIFVCLCLGWITSVIMWGYYAIKAYRGLDNQSMYLWLLIMWLFILAINIYNLFNILQ